MRRVELLALGRAPGPIARARRARSTIVVSSREASLAFCAGLLAPLGWRVDGGIVGERGERVTYLASEAGGELGLRERRPGDAPPDRDDFGLHHLAFPRPVARGVDNSAGRLSALGAELESGLREYDYSPGYYAVFFFDPDGLELGVVHRFGD